MAGAAVTDDLDFSGCADVHSSLESERGDACTSCGRAWPSVETAALGPVDGLRQAGQAVNKSELYREVTMRYGDFLKALAAAVASGEIVVKLGARNAHMCYLPEWLESQ